MTACGVNRIDALLAGGADIQPLAANDPDRAAVAVVQDFLICHGFRNMPGPLAAARGQFGSATTQNIKAFQQNCGLPVTGQVDATTLSAFVQRTAPEPVAAQGYLTLVLDIQFGGMTRLVSLTSQFEGAGRFGAINRNTDRAGLSFGLIQWAQKPGRLNALLRAFHEAQPQNFVQSLGSGDAGLAARLIEHTAKPRGGVDDSGVTSDAQFDLVNEPWVSRFRAAALDPALQQVQVKTATEDFNSSLAKLREYAPQINSERALAFMLDLANQHGDAGAKSIYQAVGGANAHSDQAGLLLALENESVQRVAAKFGVDSNEAKSTGSRRAGFRTSVLLSDSPFVA